ncbi:elongation of very long chain fatty acids protein 4-like isoform X1 [Ischnura elegans]|uniref:elongation of very long chain fatty acids protein 4-like isoform X1 n=2 Tax=Ischnura elegans TaxID=197161 RepID=UPI001ED8A3AC|nr:elongation of very long chain fatty acids protein 4-like isoform X1 [Ischnura elegans]XP_046395832.1 elongation of very long chain fatty acids protein 4-like isoform X1 [Ischnura elegans]XP_046395833.1 elongation of very long chain fatty acids protein 4-like isoform X1 [Ischnura elegans]
MNPYLTDIFSKGISMSASVINSTQETVYGLYNYYLWTLSLADVRTKGWLLVDSPLPTLLYTAVYLFIVWIGPKLMKKRKPFKLTFALVPYNLSMAALNLYICIELLIASTRLRYSYVCQPITQIMHPDEIRITHAVWWYYFSKLLEFCDTFFFILRKKENQLTFLHVYHHSTMFSLWWIGIKWVPSGSTFLPAMVNSFIHVLMYTYYGLSTFGPNVSKYLWWKKYLTILQLVQFTTALILGVNGIKNGCDFPLWMQYALVIYMVSFIVLFGNFYAKAYVEKGKQVLYGSPSKKVKSRAVHMNGYKKEN